MTDQAQGITSRPITGLTEGRIVHLVDGNMHYPAIVTRVWDKMNGCVNLTVFRDNGTVELASSRMYDTVNKANDTWHWIEQA